LYMSLFGLGIRRGGVGVYQWGVHSSGIFCPHTSLIFIDPLSN